MDLLDDLDVDWKKGLLKLHNIHCCGGRLNKFTSPLREGHSLRKLLGLSAPSPDSQLSLGLSLDSFDNALCQSIPSVQHGPLNLCRIISQTS